MIMEAASCIVDSLMRNKKIEIEQAPIYQYGYEIFISSCITCAITIGLGAMMQCLFASILYFIIFALLRSICGGYHAKTYLKCNTIYAFTTFMVLLAYKYVPDDKVTACHYCFLALSIIITYIYAPVENENKPLTEAQKKYFRIFGTAAVGLLALTSCVLKMISMGSYSILIDATLLVVAISMFVTDPSRGGEQRWAK
jgi:accessory gene regulator B